MAGNLFPAPASLEEVDGSGRLSFGVDSCSGSRKARCDGADLFATVRYLMGMVLLDAQGNQVRLGADLWPGLEILQAMSVEVTPKGAMGTSTWDLGPFYNQAELEIKYEVPPWSEDSDPNAPEDITFLIQSLDYSCEILTVPTLVGSTGTPAAQRKKVNRNIRLPLITYTMEIPKVKKPKWDKIQSYVGKVNSSAIFGGAAETVLFDGPQVGRSVTLLGDRCWKVVMKFIYNRHGWNNSLNPDTLAWEAVRNATTGATAPYETANLRELIS